MGISINGNIYKWESTSNGIPGIHLRSWCLDELLDDHHVESLELAVALVEGADLPKKNTADRGQFLKLIGDV